MTKMQMSDYAKGLPVSENEKALPQSQVATHPLTAFCALPVVPPRIFEQNVNPDRANIIRHLGKLWVTGTILHYYFFDKTGDGSQVRLEDGTLKFYSWTTTESQKEVVREAFKVWEALGIGISFQEVDSRDDAEIRIGFMVDDGAWSYIGRDAIDIVPNRDERTMNFGWDLINPVRDVDTALHEIGHALGCPHEHQNPNAGIVWNEEVVYASLGGDPNFWDRETTYNNILRKLDSREVVGSSWDPDSIMHYSFGAGLIREPVRYQGGLTPAGGLSVRDKAWVLQFYPAVASKLPKIKPFESVRLALGIGEQKDFSITPDATRDYEIRTFGTSDAVMVLFEDEKGEPRYLMGDDDSGESRNTTLLVRLLKGRKYILRIRLYYADRADETTVMMW